MKTYKLYEDDRGEPCYLIKDIAEAWYPNCVARNQTTSVRRKLEQNGILTKKIRTFVKSEGCSPRHGKYWVFSAKDMSKVEQLSPEKTKLPSVEELQEKVGKFYIIQLYPKHEPRIIKLDYSGDIEDRSRHFYVYNPKILFNKPISPTHEKTLIKMIGGKNERLGEEQFWVEDIQDMMTRAEQTFALFGDFN